jgi:hypothetical protein
MKLFSNENGDRKMSGNANSGRKKGCRKTGGRVRAAPSKITVVLRGTIAATAQEFSADAIATLAQIMGDEKAPAGARIRAAELVLDRAHGKPVPILETHVAVQQ